MPPKVPPIIVTGPEPWRGVESLPRVRELEGAGLKRSAIARIFGVSLETLRNAERNAKRNAPAQNREAQLRKFREALDRFVACGVPGVRLPDEALDRESIYFGRP